MALEGKLTEMPVFDLLRVFQRGTRSGKLVLWNQTEWALIWLLEGQAVSAVVLSKTHPRPLHTGEQAIFKLFAWTEGDFRYSPDSASSTYPVTIKRPTGELIVEALQRRKSEQKPLASGELTAQTPLCVLPQMAGVEEHIRLSVDEWYVLTRIGQHATPRQLATQTGLPVERVLLIVDHLLACGLIMCVPLADLPQRRLTVEAPGPVAGQAQPNTSISNLTRAIKRRLQQIAVGA